MNKQLFPNIKQKVTSNTCGPSCLEAIYRHYGKDRGLEGILEDLHITKEESTYGPQLARHLNNNGFKTCICSSDPNVVSPEWRNASVDSIIEDLKGWIIYHFDKKVDKIWIKKALFLLFYLQEGGNLQVNDVTRSFLDKSLQEGNIILACVAESWIWKKRKISKVAKYDNIKGKVHGHFVVVYEQEDEKYLISDPYPTNIQDKEGLYKVDKDTLITSILTWSSEILIIKDK